MKRGKFIVFEGIDGCGKTTQAVRLKNHINSYLRQTGMPILCEGQEEPYNSDVVGGIIRSVLSKQIRIPEDALAYLYVANRLTHISDILPKIESGNHIICDRYYFSNFAYNQTENTSLEDLITANKLCMELLKPDVVFYLSISPEVAAERRKKSRLTEDSNDSLEKQYRVAENYEQIFSQPNAAFAERVCRIECDHLTEDMVADTIWDYLIGNIFPNRVFN